MDQPGSFVQQRFLQKQILASEPPLPTVWLDLEKFRQFGKSLQVFGKILTVYFLFGKMLCLLWQICDIFGLIFIVSNGQIFKNNLTIWSHCLPTLLESNQ